MTRLYHVFPTQCLSFDPCAWASPCRLFLTECSCSDVTSTPAPASRALSSCTASASPGGSVLSRNACECNCPQQFQKVPEILPSAFLFERFLHNTTVQHNVNTPNAATHLYASSYGPQSFRQHIYTTTSKFWSLFLHHTWLPWRLRAL